MGDILPAGISRFAVLGFRISISLSIYRLNAIAAFRAKTIQRSIKTNFVRSKLASPLFVQTIVDNVVVHHDVGLLNEFVEDLSAFVSFQVEGD